MNYKSKYSTVFECPHCGHKNKMPCNFCAKCGKKLIEDRCLHCWRNSKKVVKSTAKSCDECNINKFSPAGFHM
ncbi:MAG: zinc ribbon domain-containing protein [Clostridium sp.]|uniref:double zinc ribbon domain-containing protein n=1 Tax=Clostridium sp. TaxID=1506 RepID=UPI0025BCBA59|nr:zinc ribbon domain-containing protein [Clostridium sp.]MCH3962966.1 zinc ribbon domain-containing protein [Clostridium sp.]MCI1800175.1 zinc ribbon domain-containing protein [Clostridium sp.]MCI2200170.1 zinc ribbon domain-containing protein [Clostridium sp.]